MSAFGLQKQMGLKSMPRVKGKRAPIWTRSGRWVPIYYRNGRLCYYVFEDAK